MTPENTECGSHAKYRVCQTDADSDRIIPSHVRLIENCQPNHKTFDLRDSVAATPVSPHVNLTLCMTHQ